MALAGEDESINHLSVTTVQIPSGPASDPLSWLPETSSDELYWFWEIPEEETSWIGIGEVVSLSFEGPERFTDASNNFEKITDLIDWEAPIDAPPPRFAVGFSFDEKSNNKVWDFLGNSRLVFPKFQRILILPQLC